MIIPESTVQLTEIYSNETINRFLNETEAFLTRFQSIEITGSMNSVRCRRSASRWSFTDRSVSLSSGIQRSSDWFRSSRQFPSERSTSIISVQNRYSLLEIKRVNVGLWKMLSCDFHFVRQTDLRSDFVASIVVSNLEEQAMETSSWSDRIDSSSKISAKAERSIIE